MPHSARAVLATGQRVCSAAHDLNGRAALFVSLFLCFLLQSSSNSSREV
jgi:hypothetical protein